MAAQLLRGGAEGRILNFDPRTKLLVLITMAAFVIGGLGGGGMEYFRLALCFLPLILLIAERKWRGALGYGLAFSAFYLIQLFLLPSTEGVINFLLIGTCGIMTRFMPSLTMGYFVMSTTTVSEFVAAMERMHVTSKIVIPMSVIFRFFPTIGEEFSAVNDAMRMRGVRFGGGKASAMLEYRLIPMMICSVKIGEELSAAALTRGLGAPVKRTNICKIGFHVQDLIVILICVFCFGLWILNTFYAV